MLEIPRYSPFDTPKSNDELYLEIENILSDLEATLAIFELEQEKSKAKQVEILIYELKNQQTLINAENHKKVGKLTKREKIENLLSQAREILQGNEAVMSKFDLERESEISHIPLPPEELEAKYFSKEDIAVSNALLAFNITELFSEEEFETRIIIDLKQTGKNDNHKIQEAVELVTDFLIDNQTLNYFCENAEFATTQTAINMPPDLIWIKEKNPKVWQAINTLVKSKKGPEFLRLLAGQPTHNTAVEETDQYDLMAKESLDASPNILSLAINISRQRLKSSTRQDLSEAEKNVLVNLYGADFLKDAEEERARDIIFTQLLAQILNETNTEKMNEMIIQLLEMLNWRDLREKNFSIEDWEKFRKILQSIETMNDKDIKKILEKMNLIITTVLGKSDRIQGYKDFTKKIKEELEKKLEKAQQNGGSKILNFFKSKDKRTSKIKNEIKDNEQMLESTQKAYEATIKLLWELFELNSNIARKLTKKEDWEKRNKEFADFCTQILYLYSKLQKYPSYREDTEDGDINNFDGFVTSYKKYKKKPLIPIGTVTIGEPEYKIVSTLDNKKELDLSGASLVGADFRSATLSQINLTNSDLTNANFEGADFSKMTNKQIEGARFNREDDNIPKWIKYGLDEEGKFSKQKLQETIREKSKTETIDLQDAKLMGLNLSDLDLTNANFRNSNLDNTLFTNTILIGANFRGTYTHVTYDVFFDKDIYKNNLRFKNTNLEGAQFDKKTLNRIKGKNLAKKSNYHPESLPEWIQQALDQDGIFSKSILMDNIKKDKDKKINLDKADLSGLELSGVDFSERKFNDTTFIDTNLEGSNWSNCELKYVDFSGAELSGANFTNTTFHHVQFDRTNIEGAKFNKNNDSIPNWIKYGLDEQDIFHKDTLKKYLTNHNDQDLSYANLREIDLSNADLTGHDFLWLIDLSGSNLSNIDLSYANAWDINLSNTNLSNATLSSAYLSSANLSNANLTGVNFGNTYLINANFSGAELKDVKNLDGVAEQVQVDNKIKIVYHNSYLIGANFSNAKNIPPHIQERLDENGIYH